MKLIMVSIRDSALNAFMRPFCVPAVGGAVRSFGDEVGNKESPMNRHPEDYELFEIGHFDEESGKVSSLAEPRSLSRGKDHDASVKA